MKWTVLKIGKTVSRFAVSKELFFLEIDIATEMRELGIRQNICASKNIINKMNTSDKNTFIIA